MEYTTLEIVGMIVALLALAVPITAMVVLVVGLIEILGDLIRASVTGEIIAVTVRYHVMGEILTTRIARHKLLSFVVH